MTSCTPDRPRSRSERRNSVQNTSVSLSPTSLPRTSRRPSADTPVAITTARETTRPPTRALQYVASRNTYGKVMCSSGRDRHNPTSASSSAQIRDTSLLLIPDSTPSAATRSSTLRVLTPSTHACITTACSATSIRRRGASSEGKNDPCRSFGIFTVRSPVVVATSLSRVPLRTAVDTARGSASPQAANRGRPLMR